MSATNDILRTYRAPRQVVADLLAMGHREDRAFAYLAVGAILVFVAQLPRLRRMAFEEEVDFMIFLSPAIMGTLILLPLVMYLVAAILHFVLRRAGRQHSAYEVRLALFWAFLASSPLTLLQGLTQSFVGPGVQSNLVGLIGFAVFVFFTWQGLRAGGAHGQRG